jgi:hypothetical protein
MDKAIITTSWDDGHPLENLAEGVDIYDSSNWRVTHAYADIA